jgi:hypothetical protein
MRRRALLLAIADYDPLSVIDYVSNDIPRLKEALLRGGYRLDDITSAGAEAGKERTRELTTARLRKFDLRFSRQRRKRG